MEKRRERDVETMLSRQYSPEIVTLNVGGVIYKTSVNTLTADPDSMLGAMFSQRYSAKQDEFGHYFIDADGKLFGHILNFLRRNTLTLPTNFDKYHALLVEAEFFQIQSLIDTLRSVTDCQILSLNVGGRAYDVPMNLLKKYPMSNLSFLVNVTRSYDRNGTCFIDGDGRMFQHVLNFLRRDELILPEDFKEFNLLLMEAEFYAIEPLIQSIRSARHTFDIVSVTVDGVVYHTTLKKLQKYPHSSLCRQLGPLDDKGRYIIDGNGEMFHYILGFLRDGNLELPEDFKSFETLLNDAVSFDIPPLVKEIRWLKEEYGRSNTLVQ